MGTKRIMQAMKVFLAALAFSAASVCGQDAGDARDGSEAAAPAGDPGLLGEDGNERPRARFEADQEARLLNKPAIAVEKERRLQGLHEAGNPHIRQGLILRNLQQDPERARVDPVQLRQSLVRMIERHQVGPDPGQEAEAVRPPRPAGDQPPAPAPAREALSAWKILLAAVGTGCLAIAAFVFLTRK